MKDFDIAFIGLGAAAMSLATRLAQQGHDGTAVFIERQTEPVNDRTWCGWGPSDHVFAPQIIRRWTRWAVSQPGESVNLGHPDTPYEMLRAADVRAAATHAIMERHDWLILPGRTLRQSQREENCWLLTLDDGQQVRARWVLDARPPPITLRRPWLWQSFLGFELTGHCFGESDTVRLMDFLDDEEPLLTFVYELPIAADRRLVELTRFSPQPANRQALRADLERLIDERQWHSASVEREEYGHLPMAPVPPFSHDRWMRIGTAGGSMRPGTGYAFHAIQRWADECAASMSRGGDPLPPRRSRLLDWLDGVFLESLWQDPVDARRQFLRLFRNTPSDALVRFLMARPTLRDILHVLRALPMTPMLKAAARHCRRPI